MSLSPMNGMPTLVLTVTLTALSFVHVWVSVVVFVPAIAVLCWTLVAFVWSIRSSSTSLAALIFASATL